MGWSPFAEWCERDETEPMIELWNEPAPDFLFDCFDLFHSQQCTGFGAAEFCPSCGGNWKHPLRVTTGEVHRPMRLRPIELEDKP